jgi:hypothetical protein
MAYFAATQIVCKHCGSPDVVKYGKFNKQNTKGIRVMKKALSLWLVSGGSVLFAESLKYIIPIEIIAVTFYGLLGIVAISVGVVWNYHLCEK